MKEHKIKLNWDADELYPYYSFSEEISLGCDEPIKVEEKLWKEYKRKANAFWEVYDKLVKLTKGGKNENI